MGVPSSAGGRHELVALDDPLVCIVVEGAVDRFCGRPYGMNPYSGRKAGDCWEAWAFGWKDAGHLLELRGRQEAARWLREKAA